MMPFESCLAALREAGPPDRLFEAIDRALAETVGHRLFTLLYVAPSGLRVKRLYTNKPREYPVGGYKDIIESPWHTRVIGERRLQTLRNLGRTVMEVQSAEEACEVAAQTLTANAADIPVQSLSGDFAASNSTVTKT